MRSKEYATRGVPGEKGHQKCIRRATRSVLEVQPPEVDWPVKKDRPLEVNWPAESTRSTIIGVSSVRPS